MKTLKNTTAIEAIIYGPSNQQNPSTSATKGAPTSNAPLIPHNRAVEFEGVRCTVRHVPDAANEAQIVLSGESGEITMSVEAFGKRYLGANAERIDAARETVKAADAAIKVLRYRPIESYSEEVQTEIRERLFAVRHVDRLSAERGAAPKEAEFAKAGVLARQDCQLLNIGAANRVPASPKKVRGLHRLWVASDRDAAALAPQHHRKGSSARKIHPRVVKLMRVAIRVDYLAMERPNIFHTHQLLKGMVQEDVKRGKLPSATKPPSYETFRNEIGRTIAAREWLARREGADAARTLRITKPGIEAERPLQYVYADHTRFDGFVLVPVRGRYYAVRPWLTVGIDLYTRCIWSAVVSLSPPSTRTLSALLRIGVLPKNGVNWDAASPYPMHGVPEVILTDRGSEFLSEYWSLTAARVGFEFRICPEPSLKAVVERFFGTVASNFCSGLPGRSFANVAERGAYEAGSNAALLMPELLRQFMLWVMDVDHNRPRKALGGKTPLEVWQEAIEDPDMQPLAVNDVDTFLIAISQVETRMITNKGVRVGGAFYASDDAQRLFATYGVGKTYEVRYEATDRSMIYLLDPDEHRWLTLTCTTPKLIADLDVTDWLKTVKLDHATGNVEDVAAAAQLKIAEERKAVKKAQKKGARPKTGDKVSDVKKALPPKPKVSAASRQNARKPVSPKTTAIRGQYAVKF